MFKRDLETGCFAGHKGGVFIYGDRSGKSNKSMDDQVVSHDFAVVENELMKYIDGRSDRVLRSNPPHVKAREFMGLIFDGKLPIDITFDPDMHNTIADHGNLKQGPDGKILKSSSIYIRNSRGNVTSIFSINYDITNIMMMHQELGEFMMTRDKEQTEPEKIINVNNVLDELIEQSVQQVGKPVALMSKDDKVRAIRFLIDHDVQGPVNLTAPSPARNAEITRALGEVLHRPTFLTVPSFGPKLLLGSELAEALLFTGQNVLPKVLQQSGYRFQHPRLDEAFAALLG